MSLAENPHSARVSRGQECPAGEASPSPLFYLILRDLENPDDLMGSRLEGIIDEGMMGLR
jgi:hypothetical protein